MEESKTPTPPTSSSAPTPPTNVREAVPVAEATKKEPTPSPVMESVASNNSETPATEESSSSSDQARYEELASKFKEDPNSLESKELPEFFDLCSKLGHSPQ